MGVLGWVQIWSYVYKYGCCTQCPIMLHRTVLHRDLNVSSMLTSDNKTLAWEFNFILAEVSFGQCYLWKRRLRINENTSSFCLRYWKYFICSLWHEYPNHAVHPPGCEMRIFQENQVRTMAVDAFAARHTQTISKHGPEYIHDPRRWISTVCAFSRLGNSNKKILFSCSFKKTQCGKYYIMKFA